ncbi:hypothetical protein E2C01_036682 [Portunus trituberculatus]|uniref:Uncharacterized protein n=1 Tax=Portunus trituberculatus TaxID=210409 RepID=A0A5B7FCL9_PORTR|nr:hypothetical protein [Portunus trituberculatus]
MKRKVKEEEEKREEVRCGGSVLVLIGIAGGVCWSVDDCGFRAGVWAAAGRSLGGDWGCGRGDSELG